MKYSLSVLLFFWGFSLNMISWTQEREQDVQLPLSWSGPGMATLFTPQGVEEIPFQMEVNIDERGGLSGDYFTNEGKIPIEKLFYGTLQEGARKVVIITVMHDEENPVLFILRGRLLHGHLYYGEVFTKRYETGGEIEKGLKIGERSIVELEDKDELPDALLAAVKASRPIGCFKITGTYTKKG